MTEDEAKTKWCPFVRVALMRTGEDGEEHPVSPAYNRMHFDSGHVPASDGSERETLCLGSQCMAWRWGEGAQRWEDFPPGVMRVLPGYTGPSSGQMVDIPQGKREGYCGLAGAPQ